ncbi:hypothetical protein EUTSA_v10028104mg [Eutrema salsugineum]|uniref:NAC domain-containing protein n=1 Tax=Eutrema salsugineum TaxID=72664 RepID=V4LX99_EUTSA|nr:NAC domain-containing protein 96 [Eutrema salsugineum]ESQ47162.1 hypothetical protein EUTSA_v10028104mg [Eutrema salsugineum]
MKNVYAKEPWLLDHTKDTFFNEDEWYYFVTRTQVSEKNIDCGKKAKRKIITDSGCWGWNAKSKKEDITDKKTGEIIGTKRTLTFGKSKKKKKKKQKTEDGAASCAIVPGSDSRWIMTEYRLKEAKGDKNFQKLVICKIREIKTKKNHHKCFSNLSQQPVNTGHESVLASSSSHQQKQLINEVHRRDPYIPSIGSENNDQVIFCKIQENMKDDHDAHHPEFVLASSLEQKPINEAHHHHHHLEITLTGLQNNDQVMRTCLTEDESATVDERNKEYNQLHIDAPLACLGSEQEPEEEETDRYQCLEDGVVLIYYRPPWMDQDLLDQYASLRPKNYSKKYTNLGDEDL